MRWLVTVQKSADLNRLIEDIRSRGGEPNQDEAPIPLGDAELVIQVSGPLELAEKLKSLPDIVDVYPDSEMEWYSAD